MSPKQRDFIVSLAAERQIPEDDKGTYVLSLVAGTAREPNPAQASAIIEWLLALPRKAVTEDTAVPAGRYALVHPERSIIEFFTVDKPTSGNWAGRTFVNQQASDDKYPVRGPRAAAVLARIAVDPQAAMLRYGTELGRCGNCGRTLTDEVSRAMGIGPDCAENLGIERITEEAAVALNAEREAAPAAPAVEVEPLIDPDVAGYLPVSTDKQGVPHAVGGWKARKAYANAQLRGEARTVKPAAHSQIEGDLPGESWEDIFGGAA